MSTDLFMEVAGLETGYLNHLHRTNELDRLESTFERIIRELDEMKTRLNPANQSK